jgi:hypothetical protein
VVEAGRGSPTRAAGDCRPCGLAGIASFAVIRVEEDRCNVERLVVVADEMREQEESK